MKDDSAPKFAQNGPLGGVKVLITRPEHQAQSFARRFEELGAEAVSHPVIRIEMASDQQFVGQCLSRLDDFAIVAFLSRNAAIAFAKALSGKESGGAMPPIGAIGTGTRSSLEERGYSVQFLPEHANSESMAETLIRRYESMRFSKPILIVRADRGSDVLPSRLEKAGIDFVELPIYQSVDVTNADPTVVSELADGGFDWITITSPAIAKNVASLFGEQISNTKIASISPNTSSAARDRGLTVHAEANEYNADGIVAAIVEHERNQHE